MRTVIFDLDGTLVDTSADLIASANHCFRSLGHGDLLHPERDAATAFRGGRAMLRLGFDRVGRPWTEADVDAQYGTLLDAYAADILVHSRMYPGAEAAVTALRGEGYAVGVCTNKPEALAETLLTRLEVRDLFDALIGADTLPVRKPDPETVREAVHRAGGDIGRTILIGDTATDRETARNAGIPAVLITFGPDGDGVSALEPEASLDRFEDLPEVARRLLPV